MEKKEIYKRRPRRVLDKTNITIPEASLSIRTLIDRTSKGVPVNARLSKHVPLPADGEILDDWDTGTEEIIDVVDAVEHADKIKRDLAYVVKKKEEERQKALGAEEPVPQSSSEAQ